MDHDKHFKVTGLSTDECHSHLVSLINKMLGAEDLIPANGNGDRFFGLTLPQVRFKLQASPESKYCTGYIPLKSQVSIKFKITFNNWILKIIFETLPLTFNICCHQSDH